MHKKLIKNLKLNLIELHKSYAIRVFHLILSALDSNTPKCQKNKNL
jgi:hypothetical protein